jgi:hypothetical protein
MSVWIALENASQASGLRVISRSHKFGKPIQQVAHGTEARRDHRRICRSLGERARPSRAPGPAASS